MKQLLLKILLLVSICSFILITVNYLFISTNCYKENLIDSELAKFDNIPQSISFANLGTSHGRDSFAFNSINGQFNFALGSQYLMYDYKLLEQYCNNFSENATIILPISYFSLYRNPFSEENKFASQNFRYYHILKPTKIINFEFSEYMRAKLPVMYLKNTVFFLRNSSSPKESKPESTAFLDNGAGAAKGHMNLILSENPQIEFNAAEYESLQKIISFCKENNLNLVFVTTPLTDKYLENFDENIMRKFYSDINKISTENNIPYLDYSKDERFTSDYSLFRNSDHLNKSGANKFTKIILEDIEKMNLTYENTQLGDA